jgi:hypothetical protein
MNSLTFYDKHEAIYFFLNVVKSLSHPCCGEKRVKFVVRQCLEQYVAMCEGEIMEPPSLQVLDLEFENDG